MMVQRLLVSRRRDRVLRQLAQRRRLLLLRLREVLELEQRATTQLLELLFWILAGTIL